MTTRAPIKAFAPLRSIKTALAAGIVALGVGAADGARAAGEAVDLIDRSWPHEGMMGTFDRAALQRGFQVFQGLCQACHGLKFVAFRDLGALGFNEEEVKAIAATYTILDGPDDLGDMFDRPGLPFDRFPSPYRNDNEARSINGGALPPDLSLIAKARGGGEDYLYSLMLGYVDPPEGFELMSGLYYNEYFSGHQIAMPQPIYEDMLEFADGTPATIEQMAADVTQFLMWAAEPKLEERKQTGLKAILFLVVFAGVMYVYKRRLWANIEH